MFEALETSDLQRMHDVLNKALGLVYSVANKDGLEPPQWVTEASKDVQAMYAEIWTRRGVDGNQSQSKGGDVNAPEKKGRQPGKETRST